MSTIDLRKLPDAERHAKINEAVAMHVAAWRRCEHACDWYIPGVGLAQGEPLVFSTSADAVLPLLSGSHWKSEFDKPTGHRCFIWCISPIKRGWAYVSCKAPTFAEAACLALLRAKGVDVIT